MPQMPLSLDLPTVLVEHLLKTKKEYEKLKKQEIHNIFIKNELGKACFQCDMTYADFKDLPKGTASERVLRSKILDIPKIPKYDRYQRGLASK